MIGQSKLSNPIVYNFLGKLCPVSCSNQRVNKKLEYNAFYILTNNVNFLTQNHRNVINANIFATTQLVCLRVPQDRFRRIWTNKKHVYHVTRRVRAVMDPIVISVIIVMMGKCLFLIYQDAYQLVQQIILRMSRLDPVSRVLNIVACVVTKTRVSHVMTTPCYPVDNVSSDVDLSRSMMT